MRYDPATYARVLPWANASGHARDRPVSILRPGDRDGAASHQADELDVWEDEGGATAGDAPEVPRANVGRRLGRHFDELSG
jgi:hypothetical protein